MGSRFHAAERRAVKPRSLGIRRRPKQERSSVTVDAILQAAAELICTIGYDRASTNRIAERAGVSIGSLYQYFANKEAILAALLEKHRREVHGVVDEALDELDDPTVPLSIGLGHLFERIMAFHRDDPDLTRVLNEEVPNLAHGSTGSDEVDHFVGRVAEVLSRRPKITVEDPTMASVLVVTTIDSLTRWMVHGAPPGFDTPGFVREAVRMLVGYLEGVRAT
jgi:AcrR family transcriptional regulator